MLVSTDTRVTRAFCSQLVWTDVDQRAIERSAGDAWTKVSEGGWGARPFVRRMNARRSRVSSSAARPSRRTRPSCTSSAPGRTSSRWRRSSPRCERAPRVPPGASSTRASTTTRSCPTRSSRTSTSRRPTASSASARAATASRPAKVLIAFEQVLVEEQPVARRGRRRRQLDARLRARRRQAAGSRSPTSRRGCARATGRCPRRSTASSPTGSRTCCFTHSPEARGEPRRRGDRRRRASTTSATR